MPAARSRPPRWPWYVYGALVGLLIVAALAVQADRAGWVDLEAAFGWLWSAG